MSIDDRRFHFSLLFLTSPPTPLLMGEGLGERSKNAESKESGFAIRK
jgi:hypothetical protein